MATWEELSLEQVCLKITDGAHSSPPSVPVGKPMASVKDLTSHGIRLESCRHISEENFQKLVKQGCQPLKGDVLIAKDGATALDTVCEVKEMEEVVLLSSVAILRPNPKVIDSSYLHYYLDSSTTRSYLKGTFVSGAAIPRVVLKDLKRATVKVPPLGEQRRIAAVLSAYDALIENSQRRIAVLEEMARRLYREWFVHFRYPGHEEHGRVDSPLGRVPAGWEAITFENLLASMTGGDWGSEQSEDNNTAQVIVIRGTDFDEVAHGGQLRAPVRYIKPSSLITRQLRAGDVIVENSINAKSRSVGTTLLVDKYVLNRLGFDAIAASFCKVFRLHDPRLAPLVHLHIRHLREDARMEYYQNVATNGIANFQGKKFATEEKLILPTDETMRSNLIAPFASIFQNVGILASQLSNLRQTRDLLLPRLLSGQITLP